jgi:hypothetical protein
MIINQVYIVGVPFVKAEDDAPVCPNRNAPKAFKVAFQGMQPETGQVHVFGPAGLVQNGKDVFYFLNVIGADAFGFPVLEEPFEALMSKALNRVTMI